MSRYLDPKADIVFKRIFADHKHLLISFLNAMLPLPVDRLIVDLSYLPNEQVPEIPLFKRTIADVKCKDAVGRIFIVEMQIDWTNSFRERLLFGVSQAFVKQIQRGEKYHLLQPVYGLGIVADTYNQWNTDWYHHYKLVKMGDMQGDVIEHLQLVFVELPKFPVQSPTEKRLRLLWLRFLREINEETRVVAQELLDVPEILEAITLAEQAAYTPGELNAYGEYWDAVSTEKTRLADKYIEGEAKGRAEGGLDKAKEIARKLRAKKIPLEEIAELTELSLAEINALIDGSRR